MQTNLSDELSQKWCLVSMLEPVERSYEFNKSQWPLHITLAGVHDADWKNKQFQAAFSELVSGIKPIEVKASHNGNLGPADSPTLVTFLQPSVELSDTHSKIVKFLDDKRAIFNNSEWNYEGYIPHSTVQNHASLQPVDIAKISNVTLIDMFPDMNGDLRKVIWSQKLA